MTPTLSLSIPQEIFSSLEAIKGVFASAKGPRVVKLQQDVDLIEKYILSQTETPTNITPVRENISVANQIQNIADKLVGISQENTLLQVISSNIQSNLNADRVVIYRFIASEQGMAISESINPDCVSLLNKILPCNFFNLETPNSQAQLLPNVYQITPSQLQFWRNFQVLSGFLLPLIVEEKLWGVMMIHYCKEMKVLSANERNLLQQVGMMLNIALKPQAVPRIETPVLNNHQQVENLSQPKMTSKVPTLISFLQEVSDTVNEGVEDCKNTLEKLRVLQQNNAIAFQRINGIREEFQEAEQVINLIKKVKESLDILSVNTSLQTIETDSEQELFSITDQVETIAQQVKETAIDIESWFQESQDTTSILKENIKSTEIDLDGVVNSIEKINQKLEIIVEIAT